MYEKEDMVGLRRGKLCIIGVNYNKASSIMIYLQTPYVTKTFVNCDDNPDMLIFNRLFYPFLLASGKGHTHSAVVEATKTHRIHRVFCGPWRLLCRGSGIRSSLSTVVAVVLLLQNVEAPHQTMWRNVNI